MKTATPIKKLDNWTGNAGLYKLSEPAKYGYGDDGGETSFIIVSATGYFACETYIFPSDENGNPIVMLEMDGSYKGGLDHRVALMNAGYTIIKSVESNVIDKDTLLLEGD